jgi:hypothetical protein
VIFVGANRRGDSLWTGREFTVAATPPASEGAIRKEQTVRLACEGTADSPVQFSVARFAGFVRESPGTPPSASRWAILSRPLRGLDPGS